MMSTRILINRCPLFTLVEVLIALTILAAVSGVVGVSIRRALFEQRFRSEVDMIVDQLRLAQDVMLILNADAHVVFKESGDEGITCQLEIDQRLPNHWSSELQRPSKLLKYIHSISTDPVQKEGSLDLQFLSDGAVMSQLIVILASSRHLDLEDTLKRYIYLPGYPAPIHSFTERSQIPSFKVEETKIKQLTEKTIEELTALNKKLSTPIKSEE